MDNSITEKANAYDKDGLVKTEVAKALGYLKALRAKFPFAENPKSIDALKPDDIFKMNPDEVGEFFHYLDYYQPLSHMPVSGSSAYLKIRLQIEDFKGLLRVVVDKKKSLAEKVDTPRGNIKGLGDDKQLVKKIIFCFNYESGALLPIVSTNHLKHFVNKTVERSIVPAKFYSLGEEYQYLTDQLIRAKNNVHLTRAWEATYFARFLYDSFPPPDSERTTVNPSGEEKTINVVTNDQLELKAFVKLLGELQATGKITGEQFRENRELWMHQQPNDRDVTVWRLKQLLKTETKVNSDAPKSQPIQKRRL